MNKGTVYTLWEYKSQNPDELSFSEGDAITILRRQDESETEWWWARLEDKEGYVPRNLLGVKFNFNVFKLIVVQFRFLPHGGDIDHILVFLLIGLV